MKTAIALLAVMQLALMQHSISAEVKLSNNGYEGVVIAINPAVPQDQQIIQDLKSMWTDASSALYEASYKHAYFRDITILVPTTWDHNDEYQVAYTENYDDADVIVTDANPLYGEVPYTLQLGGCGEQGEYIHLTPEFVKSETYEQNYGPKGKTLVKEWAHYRWGVFDEGASGDFDKFYWDNDEILQATRCSTALGGRNVNYKTGEDCEYNSRTGLPEDDCVFIVNEVQQDGVSACMMSHQFAKPVTHFCVDYEDELGPIGNVCDKQVPNEHNKICNQQSVWGVIKTSQDFQGNSAASEVSDLTPTFRVVQHQNNEKRFVLVLDSSGSMGGDKFSAMKSSTISFIDSAPDTTSIGLVDFDSGAWILANLTSKQDSHATDYLIGQMSDSSFVAGGGTDIDGGITKGLEVFDNDEQSSSGGVIIVLTDGEGTIGGTQQDCLDAEVTVHTIFLGVSVGNDKLQELCDVTRGQWCIVNDVTDTAALRECFNKFMSDSYNDGDSSNKLHQIHSKTFGTEAKGSTTSSSGSKGSVLVDSTIGKDTVFTFTWTSSSAPAEIYLRDPQNQLYCSSPSLASNCAPSVVKNDTAYNTIAFTIPGVALAGEWSYEVFTTAYDTVSVTVTSYPTSAQPIDVKSGLSVTQVADLTPVSVYAQVTQGFNPIIDATVTATVTDPSGYKSELVLLDSGAGADIRKNDGIYTRYYAGFHEPGRYSVQVSVNGTTTGSSGTSTLDNAVGFSMPAFNYGTVNSDGTVVLNENSPPSTSTDVSNDGTSTNTVESFERIASPQGLEYTGSTVDTSVDNFPPNQVTNLKAEQYNITDITQGFLLTFSAPGNNYDQGKAAGYEIRYTTSNDTSILRSSFESQLEVEADDVIVGSISSPMMSGEDERIIINLKEIQFVSNTLRVGIAIRAFDESGNVGEVSNIVVFSAYKTSPLLWNRPVLSEDCMDEKRRYISRGPFSVEDDCTSFYKCSNGYRTLHKCSSNLLFNPDISVCDWPDNVQCGPLEIVKEACKDDNGVGITGGPYKVEGDCTVYYMCSSGYKTTQYCVSGLVFNQASSICDWPANVPDC